MATPHIESKKEDIAKVVLMPGDSLRAKYIAEHFLEDARLINTVRNTFGFTGKYKGHEVTVFSSGMGIPSMGIYSYELFKFYDVDTIIRIGSAGAYTEDLKIYDVLLVEGSYSDSNFVTSPANVIEVVPELTMSCNSWKVKSPSNTIFPKVTHGTSPSPTVTCTV